LKITTAILAVLVAGLGSPTGGSASENFPPGGISIPSFGSADKYPSTIDVSGYNGTVSHVMVFIRDLTHTSPDDLDIMLVGPQGQKVMLMSDAGGGGDLTGASFRIDDNAASAMPDSSTISGDPWKPSDYEVGESLPAPAPPGPYSSLLGSFNGTNPNGTWSLYINDDAGIDEGSLDGWALNITTTTGFALADPGVAAHYPSTLAVSGLTGPITKLTAQLNDAALSWPDDLDALLVGPGGQKAILASDAGGGSSTLYDSVRLVLDDDAPSPLPDENSLVSGTYRPADYEVGDSFPAPAPGGPYGSSLAPFKGTDPNGTWSLFALDDGNAGYSGSILAGLSLNISTAAGTTTVPAEPDRVRPSGGLGLGSRRFRAAGSGGPVANSKAAPIGTRVTFRLSEAAKATFTVERAVRGVRRRGRCVARKPGANGRRCTRWVALKSSFTRDGAAGSNSFRFTGRLGNKKLSPRQYRLVMVAKDAAGNASVPARATFRIVRR
jgi:subtilisin-like proprotein convertase family protein